MLTKIDIIIKESSETFDYRSIWQQNITLFTTAKNDTFLFHYETLTSSFVYHSHGIYECSQ
jgi:hypothetical protein